MSIGDDRDLADRLGGALAAISPSPAPVGVVLRKGRVIRARRRIAAVAGAAAVAAAISVGVPILLSAGPAPAPPATGRPPVTVHRPGPGSPPGRIAWGIVDGKRWQATVTHAPRGVLGFCIRVTAVRAQCGGSWYLTRSSPVSLATAQGHGKSATAGPVWRGVVRVGVRLSDGTVLVLHPVAAYGLRWVALALPARVTIAEVIAYSTRGELAYAAPYRGTKTTWHPVDAAPSP